MPGAPPPRDSEEWVNDLRRPWARVGAALTGLTLAAIAGTAVYLLRVEPRLLTWGEVVPPDESLVGAFLPSAALLAVTAVVLRRLSSIPAGITIAPAGVRVQGRAEGTSQDLLPWSEVTVDERGDRWEGVRVRVALAHRHRSYWVSVRLAARLRLALGIDAAPATTPHPPR